MFMFYVYKYHQFLLELTLRNSVQTEEHNLAIFKYFNWMWDMIELDQVEQGTVGKGCSDASI